MMPTTGCGRYWTRSFFAASSGVWARTALLADELRRLGAVEVDQVGEVDRLRRRVGADLAGLGLHRVQRPARCCRAASRAACPASGSGPRCRAPPTRPGWRAPGRRSPRPSPAWSTSTMPTASPVAGLRTSIRSRRAPRGRRAVVAPRRSSSCRCAALHRCSLPRPFGWSANLRPRASASSASRHPVIPAAAPIWRLRRSRTRSRVAAYASDPLRRRQHRHIGAARGESDRDARSSVHCVMGEAVG